MCSETEHNGVMTAIPASTVFDVCVVGGGLVGLATADALAATYDGISILVLEKEAEVGLHQSGHNSGVVHSGLYYRPGSLKAQLCAKGRDATYSLAQEAGIPVRRTGKLVIAVDESEIPRLDELERRGTANGLIGIVRLGPDEIAQFEPAATGVTALFIPEAGVVDFSALAAHSAKKLTQAGVSIETGTALTAIEHRSGDVLAITDKREFRARSLVNCAGLHSDRVAMMAGVRPSVRIVPFRGEYYRLSTDAASLVNGLIYPVPDPRFPFLGVHFTRRVDDVVEVGPNAVLAFGREHYAGVRPDWSEVGALLRYSGFRRLVGRHWYTGTRELINSSSKLLYARVARRLVPSVAAADFTRGGVGIRAQAVDGSGRLVDDFVIEEAGSTIHVLNAPSPGATASPAIGRHIAELLGPALSGKTKP